MAQFEQHRFYCIKCGKESIPLARRHSHKHKKFHRKKLYCPWCKVEINHIECSSQEDVDAFKENFAAGVYEGEVEESLERSAHDTLF